MSCTVYKHYSDGFLLLDLINTTTAQIEQFNNENTQTATSTKITKTKTVSDYLEQANIKLTDLYETLKAYMIALGDDVQVKTLKHYIAFKRIKNFVCLEIYPQSGKILLYLKVDLSTIDLER